MKTYCVYILTNKKRGTLYIGVTGELQRRMIEHKLGKFDGFTKKYYLKKLVYVESYQYINDALKRERTLKTWLREWKISLVEEYNPEWTDLYEQFWGPFSEADHKEESQDPGSQPSPRWLWRADKARMTEFVAEAVKSSSNCSEKSMCVKDAKILSGELNNT